MNAILRSKMDEVNRDAWKVKFGSSEIQVKDLAEPILGVVKRANDYIKGALNENPYGSIAWAGVSLLLPLALNPSQQATSLAKGLDYMSLLIAQSQMREELYTRRYESSIGDQGAHANEVSRTTYKNALEILYLAIIKLQAKNYCYLIKNSASRVSLDVIKWNDWEAMMADIRTKDEEFAAVNGIWKDMKYQEEWEATEARHQEALGRWDRIIQDFTGLRAAVEDAWKDRKRTQMLDWLSDVDPSDLHNVKRDKHAQNTSCWLLEDSDEFETGLWEIRLKLVRR
ncbi:hypothetical protein CDD83_5625 [Cordyceps sp. RAO-2017]|nr:hypothetical protein CDD83_5625 [Cordyceps sp. RAO-2017]